MASKALIEEEFWNTVVAISTEGFETTRGCIVGPFPGMTLKVFDSKGNEIDKVLAVDLRDVWVMTLAADKDGELRMAANVVAQETTFYDELSVVLSNGVTLSSRNFSRADSVAE